MFNVDRKCLRDYIEDLLPTPFVVLQVQAVTGFVFVIFQHVRMWPPQRHIVQVDNAKVV